MMPSLKKWVGLGLGGLQPRPGLNLGGGRVGAVAKAARIPIAIAGHAGELMAYVVDADAPSLLGKEALGTLGSALDFCRRRLSLPR